MPPRAVDVDESFRGTPRQVNFDVETVSLTECCVSSQ